MSQLEEVEDGVENMNREEILQAIHSGVRPLPDLRRAELRGAELLRAGLQGVDLRSVRLQGADLRGAELQGVDLRGADLWMVRYDVRTQWPEGFTIPESIIFVEEES